MWWRLQETQELVNFSRIVFDINPRRAIKSCHVYDSNAKTRCQWTLQFHTLSHFFFIQILRLWLKVEVISHLGKISSSCTYLLCRQILVIKSGNRDMPLADWSDMEHRRLKSSSFYCYLWIKNNYLPFKIEHKMLSICNYYLFVCRMVVVLTRQKRIQLTKNLASFARMHAYSTKNKECWLGGNKLLLLWRWIRWADIWEDEIY